MAPGKNRCQPLTDKQVKIFDQCMYVENILTKLITKQTENEQRRSDLVKTMSSRLQRQNRQLKALQTTIANIEVRFGELINSKVEEVSGQRQNCCKERELNGNQSMIAFHTHVGVDTVTNPVVFDVVKLNIGEGYNSTSGIFTCKSDGLYGVTWTIESYDVEDVGTSLRVNGEIYGQTWSDGDSDNYDTSTGFVLITLAYGDLVWVAVDKGSRVDALQSTFSAWKIK